MNKTILSLQGLTCGHCVGSVTKVLQARDDVESAKVTLEYAVIDSDASADELIATIEQDGYQAAVATTPDVELQLSGLSCMKCAGKTQQALEAVDGVAGAIVDTERAKIYGKASIDSLIKAVEHAGYQANVI